MRQAVLCTDYPHAVGELEIKWDTNRDTSEDSR
jgi:hypothetical protein